MKIEKFEIIPAKIQDAKMLTHIACESKAHWGYPQKWIESWMDQIEVVPEFIEKEIVNKACLENGEILGFYGLLKKNSGFILQGFWVRPIFMGQGIGKTLFKHMIEVAKKNKAQFVRWESDPNAFDFYLHMGARKLGEKVYTLDGEKRILPLMQYDFFQS